MDQQVAPVPAATDPAIGRPGPAVDAEDRKDDQADRGGDDPGREVGPERGDEAGPRRSLERREPSMAEGDDDQHPSSQQCRAHDDRAAPESADARHDVHEVGRDVDAGHERGTDRAGEWQVRHHAPDDDPARERRRGSARRGRPRSVGPARRSARPPGSRRPRPPGRVVLGGGIVAASPRPARAAGSSAGGSTAGR